ncbi:hypothetical protein ACWD04_25070 [Streptomyces sp. NPDC002911]
MESSRIQRSPQEAVEAEAHPGTVEDHAPDGIALDHWPLHAEREQAEHLIGA